MINWTKLVNYLMPAFQVHSWGGLGSQLFAAHLALRLRKRFPSRNIKIVVHSSGVTRRVIEFDFVALGFQVSKVDDFQQQASVKGDNLSSKHSKHPSFSYRAYLKKVLAALGVLSYSNSEDEFNAVKPWTILIRGHYTKIGLDHESVRLIYRNLMDMSPELPSNNKKMVIHFRLGDLLALEDKLPVSARRVEQVVEETCIDVGDITVLTDSSNQDFHNFTRGTRVFPLLISESLSSNATIIVAVNSEFFLGTGSKISLWAAIFRQALFQKSVYLPEELGWSREIGLDAIWY